MILGHACESTPFLSSAESKASGVALSLSVALLPWMTCAPGEDLYIYILPLYFGVSTSVNRVGSSTSVPYYNIDLLISRTFSVDRPTHRIPGYSNREN